MAWTMFQVWFSFVGRSWSASYLPECFLRVWALLVYVDDQAAKDRSEKLPLSAIQSVLLSTF